MVDKAEIALDSQKLMQNPSDSKNNAEADATALSFNGLTKEQIMQYANDPHWVRIRWCLFALFWFVWIAMLAAAVLIVAITPKCAHRPKLQWWDTELVYQLNVATFRDLNGDGVGDLAGLASKLDHFDKIGVKSLLLQSDISNTLDGPITDETKLVAPVYGSHADLKELRAKLTQKDMHLIVDVALASNETSVVEAARALIGTWLHRYADGVRVLLGGGGADAGAAMANATRSLVEHVNKIAADTFKAKFIGFHPLADSVGQSKLIRADLAPRLFATEPRQFVEHLSAAVYPSGGGDEAPVLQLASFDSPQRLAALFAGLSAAPASSNATSPVDHLFHCVSLLLRGTPFVLYGDEIELLEPPTAAESTMKWRSGPSCQFSNNKSLAPSSECGNSVDIVMGRARGRSLPKLFKELSELRQSESLSFGKIGFPDYTADDHGDKLVAFVRQADGFDSYLVIANPVSGPAFTVNFQALFSLGVEHGRVAFFYAAPVDQKTVVEYSVDEQVDLTNLVVNYGEIVVIKF